MFILLTDINNNPALVNLDTVHTLTKSDTGIVALYGYADYINPKNGILELIPITLNYLDNFDNVRKQLLKEPPAIIDTLDIDGYPYNQ